MTDTKTAKSNFHVLGKPAGAICNLQCKYCFYLDKEKLYPHTPAPRMTEEILEIFLKDYISTQPPQTPEINIAWQGGEPTILGVDFFRKAAELVSKYKRPGLKITHSIQTNGILLDDEWGEFLSENHFLVGISIDGPGNLHDGYRVDKGGKPSLEKVLKGLEFLKKHKVDFNTLTCVQRKNSYHPKQVYDFLKSIGSNFFQFIPIVERVKGKVTQESVEPKQYGKFLNGIFDRWLEKEDVGKVFIRDFENLLAQVMGLPASICVTAPVCGKSTAIEHNGDLYSCDHFVYPENLLGNIMETPLVDLVDGEKQTQFGLDKRKKLPKYCRECQFQRVCNGGCPKERFTKTPDGEEGLNYLCEGYKVFFKHAIPTLQEMGDCLRQGRPAWEYQSGKRKR